MNARVFTIGPDHPLHPLQVRERQLDESFLRRVRAAGTFELLQLRGAHLREKGEHDKDTCWRCVALLRRTARAR